MLSNTAINTNKLIEYHLGEINHQPSACNVMAVQTGLMFCALAGLLYAAPAYAYRVKGEERYLNVVGTCHMAVLICYVAADMFFRMHLAKQWPDKELDGIVAAPLSNDEFWRQNAIIGLCAAISAIPYVTTAYTNPPADLSLGWLLAYAAFVLVAEAVLHFLSVKLTLDHPFYGLLPHKATQLLNYLGGHQKSPSELQNIEDAKDLKSKQERLERRINISSGELLASFIPSLGQLDIAKLTEFLQKPSEEQFIFLFNLKQPVKKPWPAYIENTARFLGAVTVLGACLGYAANPFLLFMDKTDSWWKALLCTFFPLYFFGVLLAYFGDEYGKRILNESALLIENIGRLWQGETLKLPLICRLYPIITFFLVFSVNIPLLIYSPAAAEEMTELAFKSVVSPEMMTMLQVFAKLGTYILAWYAPLDFQLLMLKYVTQYIRTGNTQKLILLAARMETLAEDMLQLNEENVMDIGKRIEEIPDSKTEDSLQSHARTSSWSLFGCLNRNVNRLEDDDQKARLIDGSNYNDFNT